MAEMRYTIKDSVFTYVFKQPEYARKLYLALHPEDTDVTEADCRLVTLENVLTTGMYNDVGLQVRNVLILLVEAQSIFSVNIALRISCGNLQGVCRGVQAEPVRNGTSQDSAPRAVRCLHWQPDRCAGSASAFGFV